MNIVTKKLSFVLLFLLFYAPSVLLAQGVTTAAMNGIVNDKDGQSLPGATVIATHVPTGTNYGTTTRGDGKFNLNNLRVGGPYTVKVTFIGYTSQAVDGITLKLGQNYNIDFKLTAESIQTGTINVTADKGALISANRTGASTNVGIETIEAFPTISRNFQDFAKLTPQFDGRSNSAAGRSSRFNNIQIDGTQYNDLFGLGSSGTPGGSAGTTPISLDAIQEFQVVIAPYDVRMGGFTGGGINAITKSGTNNLTGSAYYLGRNQNFMGYKPDYSRAKYASFTDYTAGLRLGGPIVKDELFFFVSGEIGKRTEPIYNTAMNLSSTIGANADRARLASLNKYGYDPGNYDAIDALRPSTKLFVRFDYNLSDEHKLVARLNYVDAAQDNWGRFSNQLGFSDRNYQMNNKTFAPVVQLTSTFGNTMTNELTLGFTSIRDHRIPESSLFPSIRINDGSNNIRIGGEEYSQANELDQDIFEFTDNFSFYMGNHVFTIGTHNEFFRFRNLYIGKIDGMYTFNNIADYEAGKIAQYELSYANNNDRTLAAKFSTMQFGGYIQDEWTIDPSLKATIGLRVDVPVFPDKPAYNPLIDAQYGALGLGSDKVPSGKLLFSPRLGLNWDASGDRSLQVRGGIGLFTGRIAYVWLSNQYGNTGVEFVRLNVSNPNFKFGDKGEGYNTLDPRLQPKAGMAGLAAVKTTEVDLTDKNFKMPQLLRINAAVDKTLPFGLTGTLEAIYSKTVNDLAYQDLNLTPAANQAGAAFTGSRTRFTKKDATNFTNIVLMKNTDEGYQYSLTAQVQGTLPIGVYTNLAYTYNRSEDLNSVGSSQAYSNYQYNPIGVDPNNPTLATSNYEIRHRIMAAVSYGFEYFKNYKTTLSLFYNGQSGRPYSYTYTRDINGDGANTNDLIYIPTTDEVSKMNMGKTETRSDKKTYFVADPKMNANFEQFIQNDEYLNSHRGQIMERNTLREPWVNMLDLKLTQEVGIFATHKVELSLDILNVLNLLNRDWGWVNTITNQNQSILSYTKTSGDSKDVYGFTQAKDVVSQNLKNDYYGVDDLSSRFQFQLGIRYAF